MAVNAVGAAALPKAERVVGVHRTWRATAVVWWRVHASPLWRHRQRTLLMLVGMAAGISLTVAILMLSLSVTRPFAGFAAAGQVELEVRPRVRDRLPETVVRVVRAVPGVRNAIPAIGGMTVLAAGPRQQGALLVGSDCSVMALLDERARCTRALGQAAGGPGAAVWLSGRLAAVLGVSPGDRLAFPGQDRSAAHVAGLLHDRRLDAVNSGFVAVAATVDVQALTSSGPFLSRVYVDTRAPAATAARLQRALGASVTVGRPGSDLSLFLRGTQWMLWVAAGIVVVSGVLMALNALLMSLEARLRTVAVLGVLGAPAGRIAAALAVEGAVLGLAAGAVAVGPGYWLGVVLARRFGRPLLEGTGATLATPFEPWVVAVAFAVGLSAGVGAMVPVLVRLGRAGPLHVFRSAEANRQALRTGMPARFWTPVVGGLLAVAGLAMAGSIRDGRLELLWSVPAVGSTAVGLLVVSFGVGPLVVGAFLRRVVRFHACGRLAIAELAREPARVSAVVATVGLAATIWIGVDSTRVLVTESVTTNLVREIGGDVYLYPRRAGQQVTGRFDDAALAWMRHVPGVAAVRPQRLAIVDDGGHVNVLGTDPAHPRDFLELGPARRAAAVWRRVAAGEVVLSTGYAARKGARAGGTVTIPAVDGTRRFRVAAVAQPRFGYDNGIGDLAVVSDQAAADVFAASVDSVIVTPATGSSPVAVARRFERSRERPEVYTNTAASTARSAGRNAERLFGPFDIISFATAAVGALAAATFIALMLEQRRRERAVLQFLGLTSRKERIALYYEGAALMLMGLGFGAVSGSTFAYLLVQIVPVLTGGAVAWHPVVSAVGLGAAAIAGIGVVAFTWPSMEAGRLNLLAAIREE